MAKRQNTIWKLQRTNCYFWLKLLFLMLSVPGRVQKWEIHHFTFKKRAFYPEWHGWNEMCSKRKLMWRTFLQIKFTKKIDPVVKKQKIYRTEMWILLQFCLQKTLLLIKKCSSQYKRAKKIESNLLYVAPHELSKLQCCCAKIDTVYIPLCTNNKYDNFTFSTSWLQKTIFRLQSFHWTAICWRNLYWLLSGSRLKSSELFARYPNSLQIEL